MLTNNDEVRTVQALHHRFQQAGVRRACVVVRDGAHRLFVDRIEAGAPPLLPVLAPYLPPPEEWEHEAVFIGRPSDEHPEIDTLFFAFVHNTQRGLAQGGLRLRDYTEIGELDKLFEDGLRLSQGMTMKNAMARLWWGGGKGIIAETPELAPRIRRSKGGHPGEAAGGEEPAYPKPRAALFEEYGRFVSEIGGVYYTAADMNTDGRDMLCVLRATRFVTCLPPSAGGSADPSPFTADGVFSSIGAAWKFLGGTDSLRDVRVAVQGAGKVGGPLVMDLLQAGARVWAGDTNLRALDDVAERVQAGGGDPARLTVVPLTDDLDAILRQEVDVIAPCAGGQTINQDTIPQFAPTVKLVCGAANNMLGDEDADAALLHERGICYVPDFVCNRMGIMNCADEWMGYLEVDSRSEVQRVVADVEEIVGEWKNEGTPTLQKGREMALRRLAEEHPLERMRGRGAKLLECYLKGLTPAR